MVREIGVGVNRDRGDVELSAERATVQGFDVLQLVNVADALGIDLSVRERVEHERVVGIGAVGEMDRAGCRHDLYAETFARLLKRVGDVVLVSHVFLAFLG